MPRALEAVVGSVLPARLGAGFRWLWSASTLTNIGDGIVLAAGPLLVASQTRDPFVVSLAFFCEFLPSLVFGTFAGVVVDRADRRRIIILVNLVRAGVLAVLATTIATGSISVPIVLLGLLLLGTAETFADLASTSLLPRLVPRASIGLANARLQGGYLLMNQLIGPPIGAFLFVAGMAIPFATDAVCYALGAVLVSRIASSVASGPATEPAAEPEPAGARAPAAPTEPRAATATSPATPPPASSLWRDLADGFRWLRTNPPMRTLALTVVAFNVTFGAAWSVLVLYAGDRLGMDSVGFGLLTTASSIGGVLGTAAYGALDRRFSLADLMRAGLLIETGTHLTFALTRSPEVALLTMVVFGAHEVVWWTITIRQ